jgi:hypothetical protein
LEEKRSVERTAVGPLCRAKFSMHVSGRGPIGRLAKPLQLRLLAARTGAPRLSNGPIDLK